MSLKYHEYHIITHFKLENYKCRLYCSLKSLLDCTFECYEKLNSRFGRTQVRHELFLRCRNYVLPERTLWALQFPQSDNAVLRMVSIAWAGALIQAGICGAAVVRSHSAKTIYRMTRLNGIMMIAGVFFVATWKTVFTGRGNNDCADAMTGQAVLYAALTFFAFHAIEGKAQKMVVEVKNSLTFLLGVVSLCVCPFVFIIII